MTETETFLRCEHKYPMNRSLMKEFLEEAEVHLVPDQYPEYELHSIYYDTEDSGMIIHCLDHPMYKEKLRLRSYGEPKEGQPVYLELKKKFKDTDQKRRIALEESEAYAYLNQGVVPHLSSGTQIYSEIDYLVRRKKVVPKMFIAYHRIAFCGKEEADLRITFDSAIRFRSSHISLHESGREQYLTSPEEILMEVKLSGRYPYWLSDLLSKMKLFRSSFSKYGTFYTMQEQKQISDQVATVPESISLNQESEESICSLPY